MGDVIKFKSSSPLSWTVEDALEYALEGIKNGTFTEDKVYIALCGGDGKTMTTTHIMAGMNGLEAIGWLYFHTRHIATEDD
jgi:hypothetical protein